MIRSNYLIGPPTVTYKRTYEPDDWKNNCIAYLDEARALARDHSPAKVLLYVRLEQGKKRSLRRLAATIVCNVRRY